MPTGVVHRRQRLWATISAIWLFVIVLIFVAVQISRVNTPIAGWLNKIADVLYRR